MFFSLEGCETLAIRPGIEPAASALEGEVSTTAPSEKPHSLVLETLPPLNLCDSSDSSFPNNWRGIVTTFSDI